MSTWNLTVTTKRTSFRFGGPDGNRISISGRGTLEFDESELRSKKASADDIASLLATTEHPITWELRDNVEWVESVLTDYVAFGHTRAAKIRGLLEGVNTPPPKGGGFGLRLEAGLIGHTADYTTVKSSSGSGGFWFLMYSCHTSSVTFPLVATQ